jgi:hypothetical protein
MRFKNKKKKKEQEHEMCKTNMKTNVYYVNIYKYEHKKNMIRLWRNIVPKVGIEQTEGNEGSYFYLYPCGNIAQRSFQGNFYVCIE